MQGLILLAPPFPGHKVGASEVRQACFLGRDSPPQLHKLERKTTQFGGHRTPATENFASEPASYWYDLVGCNEVAVARQLNIPSSACTVANDFTVIDVEHWQEGLKVRVDTISALNRMPRAGIANPRNEYYDPVTSLSRSIGAIGVHQKSACQLKRNRQTTKNTEEELHQVGVLLTAPRAIHEGVGCTAITGW